MKIAFMGTPEFAVPSLKMLMNEGHELIVITQPDRPKNRGHSFAMPPVKLLAMDNGIPVYQFERIKDKEGVDCLKEFKPDLMVTAAFGQMLSQEVLDIPKYGCINVHGSLLPKYRGAAPIQWAIINGETVTGVTTMMTNIGMDTGDILLSDETPIGEEETYGELYLRLSLIGAQVLKRTIAALLDGSLVRIPQDESKASRCRMIKKEDALVDFSKSAGEIKNLIRGLNPAPAAYTVIDGQRLKLYNAEVCEEAKINGKGESDEVIKARKKDLLNESLLGNDEKKTGQADGKPFAVGECVIASSKHGLFVETGDGLIEITELQFENSKRMRAKAALNGKKLEGRILGV